MTTTTETQAITIHCTCGRRGFVAARFAGRKVRCTGCGEAVRVGPAARPERSRARAQVAALAAAPALAPARASAPAAVDVAPPADCGLDLLPAVERRAPDWETRLRPAARGEVTRSDHEPTPPARGRPRRGGDASRRDVDVEAHLRAIAFWQLASGALGVLGMLAFALLGLGSQAPVGGLLLVTLVGAAVSLVTGGLGYLLWSYNGGARIVFMVLSGLTTLGHLAQLVLAPGLVGKLVMALALAWPLAIFLVVAGPRAGHVCTASYRGLVARTPGVRVRWWASPFFYLPIVFTILLGGALVVMLGVAVRSF